MAKVQCRLRFWEFLGHDWVGDLGRERRSLFHTQWKQLILTKLGPVLALVETQQSGEVDDILLLTPEQVETQKSEWPVAGVPQ